jgi:hypothetical protein
LCYGYLKEAVRSMGCGIFFCVFDKKTVAFLMYLIVVASFLII